MYVYVYVLFYCYKLFINQYNINFITVSLQNFMVSVKATPFISLPTLNYFWCLVFYIKGWVFIFVLHSYSWKSLILSPWLITISPWLFIFRSNFLISALWYLLHLFSQALIWSSPVTIPLSVHALCCYMGNQVSECQNSLQKLVLYLNL